MNKIRNGACLFLGRLLSKFHNKLIVNFLIISVIPILIVGSLSFILSFNISKERILESVSYTNSQLNSSLESRFNQMENASSVVKYYLYMLILQPTNSTSEQLERYSNIRNNISNLQNTFEFASISVYTHDKFLFSSEGITFFKFSNLDQRGISIDEIVPVSNQIQWELFLEVKEPFVIHNSRRPQDYISVYNSFKNKDSESLDYVFFVDIPVDEITTLLFESIPDDSVSRLIVNQEGKVLVHTDSTFEQDTLDEVIMTQIKNNNGVIFEERGNYYITSYNSVTNWFTVAEVPKKYIMSNSNILINILLVTVLLVIIAAIISSLFISKNLSRKVMDLAQSLTKVNFKGNSKKIANIKSMEKPYKDEFDQLVDIFNGMINKINLDFEHILDMSKKEEKMKYQLQQLKINPHFLYNILDSIKTCQQLGRIEDAELMISKLARFYKLILKKGDELITIRDEIEITTLFLEIESISKKGSFSWEFFLDESIENFLIPKFTLQPVVENAIKHGLSSSKRKLLLNIVCQFEEDEIIIIVEDNGIGITQNKLAEIEGILRNNSTKTKEHFGLCNVNMRIQMYSQREQGLYLSSKEGIGTTVTIKFEQMLSDDFIESL
ncbi:sensor histidine kinase [Halalkalibacter okhensis]|uniref:Histidine kinase n=1 Tax=Halalkalibacter okhensis TaxID=333138 RepID=A0A0B0IKY9_9BACI|nr:histidine kinase [Halalkalibacter okhensis]KHF41557.1 hypothetical protein LQ50_02265 [Halalkalibacter okhensis]